MDDAVLMSVVEAAEQLRRDGDGVGQLEWPAFDFGGQRLAVVVAHDEDDLAVGELFDLVDSADVGVVEHGGGAGLLQEAVLLRGVREGGGGEILQRDESMQKKIFCFADHSHGPAAQLLQDLVVRDGLALMHRWVPGFAAGSAAFAQEMLRGFPKAPRRRRRLRRWCETRSGLGTSSGWA